MSGVAWFWLSIAVLGTIGANTFLKTTMSGLDAVTGRSILGLMSSPSLWIGAFCCGVLLAAYLMALRSLPMSLAYLTVTSSGAVGMVIIDRLHFGTPVGPLKALGILAVLVGLALIVREPR